MGMRGEWWDGESLWGRGRQSERGAAETNGEGEDAGGMLEKEIHYCHIFSLPVAD